jgi:hypothetical protein
MNAELKQIADKYLPKIERAVNEAPWLNLFVRKSGRRNRYEFHCNRVSQKIPKSAGVYLAYYKKQRFPIYIGETGDLQRLRYHVSDNESSQNESTLKRKFKRKFPGQKINSEFFQKHCTFKFVEIPFGRIEVESHLKKILNAPV